MAKGFVLFAIAIFATTSGIAAAGPALGGTISPAATSNTGAAHYSSSLGGAHFGAGDFGGSSGGHGGSGLGSRSAAASSHGATLASHANHAAKGIQIERTHVAIDRLSSHGTEMHHHHHHHTLRSEPAYFDFEHPPRFVSGSCLDNIDPSRPFSDCLRGPTKTGAARDAR